MEIIQQQSEIAQMVSFINRLVWLIFFIKHILYAKMECYSM